MNTFSIDTKGTRNMIDGSKYTGSPDCDKCQNGEGKGNCGLNLFFNKKNIKAFDIYVHFFKKQDGLNTHYKTPGVMFRDGERCHWQIMATADLEWICMLTRKDCDHVCKEDQCKIRPKNGASIVSTMPTVATYEDGDENRDGELADELDHEMADYDGNTPY